MPRVLPWYWYSNSSNSSYWCSGWEFNEDLDGGFQKQWAYMEWCWREWRKKQGPNRLDIFGFGDWRNFSGLIHVPLCRGHTLPKKKISETSRTLLNNPYHYWLRSITNIICQVDLEFLERGYRKLWACLERFRGDFPPNQLVVYDVSYRRNISGVIHVYLCCGHTLFKNKIPETTRTLLINFEFYLLRVIWLWFLYWQTVHPGLSSLLRLRLFVTPGLFFGHFFGM